MTDFKKLKNTEGDGSRAVFCQNLREIVLNRLRWSHGRLGKELGISQGQATKYLNGISTPPFEKMDLLEEKTGVPIMEFFRKESTYKELADKVGVLNESNSNNAKLVNELIHKLTDGGVSLSEIHVLEGSKNDRLEAFLRDVAQTSKLNESFFDLLIEGADQDTLQIEFLREYCHMLIAAGGALASRAKKVLSDILQADRGHKK